MQKIFWAGMLWLCLVAPVVADPLVEPWTELLARHVRWSDDGHASAVDYAGMASERAQLQAYLRSLSEVSEADYRRWRAAQRMAFLINAYNAYTVELILREPVLPDSIRDLGGWFSSPWKLRWFELLGATRSLDEIEHEWLRGDSEHADPRIHFAVNCASIGCPALRPEAYTAELLPAQLADQTRRFLSDRSRNRLDGRRLLVSPIFKWYAEDFATGWQGSESVAAFLALHGAALGLSATQLEALREGELRLGYSDYDWRLNRLR